MKRPRWRALVSSGGQVARDEAAAARRDAPKCLARTQIFSSPSAAVPRSASAINQTGNAPTPEQSARQLETPITRRSLPGVGSWLLVRLLLWPSTLALDASPSSKHCIVPLTCHEMTRAR